MTVPVWCWRDAIRKADVAPLTKHVCNCLANYLSDCGTGCWPSVTALMVDSGLSNRSIATHLAAAADAGLIVIERRKGADGRHQRTVYLPRFPDAAELARTPADMVDDPREAPSRGAAQVKRAHVARPGEAPSRGPREPDDQNPREPPSRRTIHRELSTLPPSPPAPAEAERERVPGASIGASAAHTAAVPATSGPPELVVEPDPEFVAAPGALRAPEGANEDDPEVARRMGWLAEVAADGRHPIVVEAFLRPMLATLTVPKGRQPIEFLRDLRDAAAVAKATKPALEAAAKAARRDRVRDLPWPKDVGRLIEQAGLAAKVQLSHPDPRWYAWLAHDMADPSKASFARTTRDRRWGYVADTDWPPPSPEIDASRRPLEIIWGTPEHAAWLAYWRNTGRAAIAQGHDMKGPGSGFLSDERWPVVASGASGARPAPAQAISQEAPSVAHKASGAATSEGTR